MDNERGESPTEHRSRGAPKNRHTCSKVEKMELGPDWYTHDELRHLAGRELQRRGLQLPDLLLEQQHYAVVGRVHARAHEVGAHRAQARHLMLRLAAGWRQRPLHGGGGGPLRAAVAGLSQGRRRRRRRRRLRLLLCLLPPPCLLLLLLVALELPLELLQLARLGPQRRARALRLAPQLELRVGLGLG